MATTASSTKRVDVETPARPTIQTRDYYDVLEVSKEATLEQIRVAYRVLGLRWRPETHMANKEEKARRFMEIHTAFVVLSDPDSRAIYDHMTSASPSSSPNTNYTHTTSSSDREKDVSVNYPTPTSPVEKHAPSPRRSEAEPVLAVEPPVPAVEPPVPAVEPPGDPIESKEQEQEQQPTPPAEEPVPLPTIQTPSQFPLPLSVSGSSLGGQEKDKDIEEAERVLEETGGDEPEGTTPVVPADEVQVETGVTAEAEAEPTIPIPTSPLRARSTSSRGRSDVTKVLGGSVVGADENEKVAGVTEDVAVAIAVATGPELEAAIPTEAEAVDQPAVLGENEEPAKEEEKETRETLPILLEGDAANLTPTSSDEAIIPLTSTPLPLDDTAVPPADEADKAEAKESNGGDVAAGSAELKPEVEVEAEGGVPVEAEAKVDNPPVDEPVVPLTDDVPIAEGAPVSDDAPREVPILVLGGFNGKEADVSSAPAPLPPNDSTPTGQNENQTTPADPVVPDPAPDFTPVKEESDLVEISRAKAPLGDASNGVRRSVSAHHNRSASVPPLSRSTRATSAERPKTPKSILKDTRPPPIQSLTSSSNGSVPGEWVYPLQVPLETLYTGAKLRYRVTRYLLSGSTQESYVDIEVKPGWRKGTRVRFQGLGNERAPPLSPQDVIFIVDEAPHPRFRREGANLITIVDIPLFDALAGEQHVVPGLDGKDIVVDVSSFAGGIIRPGDISRVEGKGMPIRKNSQVVGQGDMIIRWNIIFPHHLTERQQHLVREARDIDPVIDEET